MSSFKKIPKLWSLILVTGLVISAGFKEEAQSETLKKLVVVAGRPSHGPGDHEFNAGCLLLIKCLKEATPELEVAFVRGVGRKIQRYLTMQMLSFCIWTVVADTLQYNPRG